VHILSLSSFELDELGVVHVSKLVDLKTKVSSGSLVGSVGVRDELMVLLERSKSEVGHIRTVLLFVLHLFVSCPLGP